MLFPEEEGDVAEYLYQSQQRNCSVHLEQSAAPPRLQVQRCHSDEGLRLDCCSGHRGSYTETCAGVSVDLVVVQDDECHHVSVC